MFQSALSRRRKVSAVHRVVVTPESQSVFSFLQEVHKWSFKVSIDLPRPIDLILTPRILDGLSEVLHFVLTLMVFQQRIRQLRYT